MGRHSLKMGGEFRRGTDDFDLGFFFVGRFVFNGTTPATRSPTSCSGAPSSSTTPRGARSSRCATRTSARSSRTTSRSRDSLTLNLGVRYDYYSPITDALGQTSTFVVRRSRHRRAAERRGRGHHRRHQRPAENSTYFPDRNNLQPRVGLAWDVFGDGRLALRGGGGVFHNQLRNNLALAAHPVVSVPGAAGLPRHDAREPDQARDGRANHRPAVLDRSRTSSCRTPSPTASGRSGSSPETMVAEVAYVQNDGNDLLQFEEMNQPIYVAGQTTAANKDLFGPTGLQLGAAIDQLGPLRLQGRSR